MMEVGQPEQKRPRMAHPPQWHTGNAADSSRQLPPPNFPPPPPQPPYTSRAPEPLQSLSSLDRRHSGHNEHPYYDSQDPRRPHSGPSHGYLPPHTGPPPPQLSSFNGQRDPARDPMIKRDPSEEQSQIAYGRSPSNPSDHNVNSHHQPHEVPNRPYPPYQHGLSSYESSHPPQQRTNSYPPPSPMAAPDQYGPPSYPRPQPGPQEQYPALAYPTASTPRGNEVKRKAQRAAQACDSCRTLKAKCDEGRPTCSTCSEKNLPCNYRDPPPKQPEKGSAEMIDAMGRLEGRLEGILKDVMAESVSRFDFIKRRLDETDKIQRFILSAIGKPSIELKQEPMEPHPALPPSTGPSEYPRQSLHSEQSLLLREELEYTSDMGVVVQPEEIVNPIIQDEGSEEDDGELRAPKMPTIPVNHTTGAARLLTAPGIRDLVRDIIGPGKIIKNERYPMTMEEKRGSLRLFGRGEGTEITPGYDRDPMQDHVSDSTPGDAHSDTSSPAPTGEEWGQIGGLTPPAHPTHEIVRGEISSDGMPDFSKETVYKLVNSYKENINNMHPILAPAGLDKMVESFLKQIPETQAKPKQLANLFVGGNRYPESPGNKRKRSPGVGEHHELTPLHWEQRKPGHPFRSITSALVLLVMALGKICLHKAKLPDIARDGDANIVDSPVLRNGHPFSPIQSSPSLTTIPSPADMHTRSRRTSTDGPLLPEKERARAKNIDRIPGLSYFAFATDVIGNQLGGNKLQHVHACLLAGLYHGQLGRVLESHAYIHQACYSLEGILRKRFERLRKTNALNISTKDNPIVFAFWTCLQLESDIIAELPVPQSNILTYEDDMPGPNLKIAEEMDGFDSFQLESYTAQLFLRKHLNSLHNMFYKPNTTVPLSIRNKKGEESRHPTIDALEFGLADMHKVAPSMIWDMEKGERSSSILHARLRAKYYGAKVITYRPFLLKIMEVQRPRVAQSVKNAAPIENEWKEDVGAPPVNPLATSIDDIDPKAIEYAQKAILALIHSTSAFHDVVDCGRQRLLVTNVWGTAHAQWGNLITLQACYCDPILGPLVARLISREELSDLIQKTSAFLNFVATRTSAIAADNYILRHVGENLGLLRSSKQNSVAVYRGPDTSSSFTSAGSGSGGEVAMSGY